MVKISPLIASMLIGLAAAIPQQAPSGTGGFGGAPGGAAPTGGFGGQGGFPSGTGFPGGPKPTGGFGSFGAGPHSGGPQHTGGPHSGGPRPTGGTLFSIAE